MKLSQLEVNEVYKGKDSWPLNGAKVRVLKVRARRNHMPDEPADKVRVTVERTIGSFPTPKVGEILLVNARDIHSPWDTEHEALFERFDRAHAERMANAGAVEAAGVEGARLSPDGKHVTLPVHAYLKLVAAAEQAAAIVAREAYGDPGSKWNVEADMMSESELRRRGL